MRRERKGVGKQRTSERREVERERRRKLRRVEKETMKTESNSEERETDSSMETIKTGETVQCKRDRERREQE